MMHTLVNQPAAEFESFARIGVNDCYQCGKCSAGCPMADKMDVLPNRLLRLLQMGKAEQAASAEAIWMCVSCQTCSTRCPKSVDCAGAMDALRELAVKLAVFPADMNRTVLFQKEFLSNIRRYGRINEVDLIARHKLFSFMKDWNIPLLMKDAFIAPKLLQRGKFHLQGEKVKDRDLVGRIFSRCEL
jgi:heterodisulfide reductase subunit C2